MKRLSILALTVCAIAILAFRADAQQIDPTGFYISRDSDGTPEWRVTIAKERDQFVSRWFTSQGNELQYAGRFEQQGNQWLETYSDAPNLYSCCPWRWQLVSADPLAFDDGIEDGYRLTVEKPTSAKKGCACTGGDVCLCEKCECAQFTQDKPAPTPPATPPVLIPVVPMRPYFVLGQQRHYNLQQRALANYYYHGILARPMPVYVVPVAPVAPIAPKP